MDAATSRVSSDLESSLNSMFDNFGGRDDQNSMATLLANRTRSDAGASLAGTRASLEGQANDIERSNYTANLAGEGQQQQYLAQVLSALKGGTTSTTGAVNTAEQQAGTSSQAGNQATTGSEQATTNQTQVQNLVEALSQILSGTTHTVGTEDSKNSSMGGGMSLGL